MSRVGRVSANRPPSSLARRRDKGHNLRRVGTALARLQRSVRAGARPEGRSAVNPPPNSPAVHAAGVGCRRGHGSHELERAADRAGVGVGGHDAAPRSCRPTECQLQSPSAAHPQHPGGSRQGPFAAVAHFSSQPSELHLQQLVIPQAGWRAHRRPPLLAAKSPSRRPGLSTDSSPRSAPGQSVSSTPASAQSSPAQSSSTQSSSARTPCRASTARCASACDVLQPKSSSAETSNTSRSCMNDLYHLRRSYYSRQRSYAEDVSHLLRRPPMTRYQ